MSAKVLPYLFLLYTVIILSYLLGHFLFMCFSQVNLKNITAFFIKLLIGITAIIVSVAVWRTQGLTVNFYFLVIAIAFFFSYRNNKSTQSPPIKKIYLPFIELNKFSFFIILALPLFFFFLRIIETVNWDMQEIYLHWGLLDHGYYARIADGLQFGVENRSGMLNQWQPDKVLLYHYYELWFIFVFSRLHNFLTVYVYELVAFPFFNVLLFMAYYAVYEVLSAEKKHKNYLVITILLFAILFYPSFASFDFLRNLGFIEYFNRVQFFNTLYILKLGILKSFFALFVILWFSKQKTAALLVLLTLPICNIVTLPAIFGAVGLYVLLNFKYYWITKKEAYLLLFTMFGFCIFLVLLTFISTPTTTITSNSKLPITNLYDLPHTFLKILDNFLLRYLLLHLPFILLAIFVMMINKHLQKQLYSFGFITILLLVVGLGLAVFVENPDNWQIIFLPTLLISEIAIIFCLIYFYVNSDTFSKSKTLSTNFPKLQFFITLILLFICLLGFKNIISQNIGFKNIANLVNGKSMTFPPSNSYTKSYLDSIRSILQDLEQDTNFNKLGLSLSDTANYYDDFAIYPFVYQPFGHYLGYASNNYETLNVSLYKVQYLAKRSDTQAYINNNFFIKYLVKQQENGTFTSYENSLLDFIKIYHIRYAIATKEVKLEAVLQPFIAQIITNSVNGERFIVFKKVK